LINHKSLKFKIVLYQTKEYKFSVTIKLIKEHE